MDSTNNRVWTAKEVGEFLQKSAKKINAMANAGEIPAKRVGGVWRFDPDRVREWMRDN